MSRSARCPPHFSVGELARTRSLPDLLALTPEQLASLPPDDRTHVELIQRELGRPPDPPAPLPSPLSTRVVWRGPL